MLTLLCSNKYIQWCTGLSHIVVMAWSSLCVTEFYSWVALSVTKWSSWVAFFVLQNDEWHFLHYKMIFMSGTLCPIKMIFMNGTLCVTEWSSWVTALHVIDRSSWVALFALFSDLYEWHSLYFHTGTIFRTILFKLLKTWKLVHVKIFFSTNTGQIILKFSWKFCYHLFLQSFISKKRKNFFSNLKSWMSLTILLNLLIHYDHDRCLFQRHYSNK